MHSETHLHSSSSRPTGKHSKQASHQVAAANIYTSVSFKTQSSQLQSASSLLSSVSTELSSCPSDFYILVSQPGVHILDFSNRRSAPRLRERVLQQDDLIKSSFSVSEVVGEFDAASLQKQLEKECKAETIVVNGDGRW